MYDIIFIGDKSSPSYAKLKEKYPVAKCATNAEEASKKSFTKMFWVVWPDLLINPEFKFNYVVPTWDQQYVHVFKNGENYDGIVLVPKATLPSNKEFTHRFFVNNKEIDVVASTPLRYNVVNISSYDDYLNALHTSDTELIWLVFNDIDVEPTFDFSLYFSHHNSYDRKMNHVFKNGEFYDGIILASKHKVISKREFDHRFLVDKKEWDVVASTPKKYNKATVSSYDEYVAALDTSLTEMLWLVFNDIDVKPTFDFSLYFSHHDSYNRKMNHVFKNGEFYDGIILASKHKVISKREFENRFLVEKKEWDVVASTPKPYDKFMINSYDDYLSAVNQTTTPMFWAVWPDVTISENFNFEYRIPAYDSFQRNITHVFKNGEFYDGICLFSKNATVSAREFEYRFFVNKKEVDINASKPKPYDKFMIKTYDDYLDAVNKSTTPMFWAVWPDVVVNPQFDYNYYVPAYDSFHRNITHVFKNGEFYDGICLFSKNATVSAREINYRFFSDKKEVDINASNPKPYDIVFISYFEKFADENFQQLLEKVGTSHSIYRVNGVNGIHQAHRAAAQLATTDMFWVVDADAILNPSFNFNFPQVVYHDTYTKSIVHVWKSRNPINGLEYGYGGVKLLPRQLTLDMDMTNPDMTTSISASFKAMPEVSNVAGFNTDPFTTWRSAFRECCKLASKTIQGQVNQETEERLNVWCTVGADKPFGDYAIAGALAGKQYGQENAGNLPALSLINDYDWLKNQFE